MNYWITTKGHPVEVRFSLEQLRLIRFISVECHLQGAGELSVFDMCQAWAYAQDMNNFWPSTPARGHVIRLGQLVVPMLNQNGFRQTPVTKRDGASFPHGQQVQPLIDNLLNFCGVITAQDWFRAFEEIHPFRDGNGRVGLILYNWLNGTLDSPVWPKDPFGDPRRAPGYGAP